MRRTSRSPLLAVAPGLAPIVAPNGDSDWILVTNISLSAGLPFDAGGVPLHPAPSTLKANVVDADAAGQPGQGPGRRA